MSSTTFVNGTTLTDADWFNDVNRLHYTIFGDPADGAQAVTSLGNQAGYLPWTTAGTATAFTLTPTPASTGNVSGQRFRVNFNAAAGATPTLSVSGMTAKSLKYKDSTGTKQAITSTQVPSGWISDVEYDGTDWVVLTIPPPGSNVLPRGYIAGLTLSNNATAYAIDVAAGTCRDSTNTIDITLSTAVTGGVLQAAGAWAAGNTANKLDTGARANDTWYHVYAIRKDSDGSGDWLYSLSASSPTMPGGYTYFRRIGSVLTNAGTDIIDFTQVGEEFLWSAAVIDVDATNPGTAAVTRTLTTPLGVKTIALITAGNYNGSNNGNSLFSSLDVTDQAPQAETTAALTGFSSQAGTGTVAAWWLSTHQIRTNTSSQIRSRLSASGAADHIGIITRGWIDTRGRYS